MKTNRRQFISTIGAASTAFLIPGQLLLRKASAQSSGGILDPASIPKYVTPLVIPPAMPRAGKVKHAPRQNFDYYQIAVRQFRQHILPPGMPSTTVWSYGSATDPNSFHYPAFTIEAKVNRPVRVNWINDLVDANGDYLPHLLPVDQTLHWANPPGGFDHRDHYGDDPTPYRGPVPIVTHVHGAHTTQDSDGFAEAWYLPHARNIDPAYARTGTWYDAFRDQFRRTWGVDWQPGSAVFQYPNDQPATALWYHDHVLGMTRLNVYAGPAGFYLLRGGTGDLPEGLLPGPAPALADPPGTRYYEIPLAIQDRTFNMDGSLFYPNSREIFDGFAGPYAPQSDIAPIWNPEFFGNAMLVNGRTWPTLTVEPRRYRFRILNGCNSRFLILKLVTNALARRPASAALPFWQIGAEGGFLPPL
jgi:spore coat protein A, manganese oxidase